MLTVYKYEIPIEDYFVLDLPTDAQILRVDIQDGKPWLWALVDPNNPLTRRTFRFAGTGHPIVKHTQLKYINTFQMRGGALIFHIFEVVI